MRKLVLLGLFALSLGLFSNALLAGNVADCDILTLNEPDNEFYMPNMYGLCVAWYNADEQAKDKIADRFADRAGFDVPNSVPSDSQTVLFECACWNTVSYDDICQLGAPSSGALMNQSGYQLGYLRFEDSMSFEFNFASDTYANRCAHSIQDAAGELVFGSYDGTLTDAEASQCVFELQVMQDMYTDSILCPPDP